MKNHSLAGVGLQNKGDISDFNIIELGKITGALSQGHLPYSFTQIIEVTNPNEKDASLNETDWILFIDKQKVLEGTSSEEVFVPANGGKAILNLDFQFNMLDLANSDKLTVIFKLLRNLKGNSDDPVLLGIEVRPSFNIGGKKIKYPGYILVEKTTDEL